MTPQKTLEATIIKPNKNSTDYQDIEAILCQKSADPDALLENGETYLTYAIHARDSFLIKSLLTHPKLNLNQANELGWYPLHLAVKYGDDELYQLLLAKGADPKVRCNEQTPQEFKFTQEIFQHRLSSYLAILTLPTVLIAKVFSSLLSNFLKFDLFRRLDTFNPQHWILSKMKGLKKDDTVALGDGKGVCAGVARASILMFLTNQCDQAGKNISLNKLCELIERMKVMSLEAFLIRVDALEKKRKNLWCSVQDDVEKMSPQDIASMSRDYEIPSSKTSLEKKQALIQLIFEKRLEETFHQHERLDLEMLPFIHSVEVLQHIEAHPELYPKDDVISQQSYSSMLLVAPEVLLAQGGPVEVDDNLGVFSKDPEKQEDELLLYFEQLSVVFQSLDFPVSLELNSNGHSISVHYDPKERHWICVDANQIGGYSRDGVAIPITKSTKEMSEFVWHAFFKQKHTILRTHFFTAGNNQLILKNKLNALQNNTTMREILEITDVKSHAKDKGGACISYVTSPKMLKRLHEQGRIPDNEYAGNIAWILEETLKKKHDAEHYQPEAPHELGNSWVKKEVERYKIVLFLYTLSEKFKTSSSSRKQILLEINFWVDVLSETMEKKCTIYEAVRNNYACYLYQGHDIQALFEGDACVEQRQYLEDLMKGYALNMRLKGCLSSESGLMSLDNNDVSMKEMLSSLEKSCHIDKTSNLQMIAKNTSDGSVKEMLSSLEKIYQIDKALSQKMIAIMHDFQHHEIQREYLMNVFKKAGELAVGILTENEMHGVLNKALDSVYEDYSSEHQSSLALLKDNLLSFKERLSVLKNSGTDNNADIDRPASDLNSLD